MLLNIDFEGNILGFAYFIDGACFLKDLNGEGFDISLPTRVDYMSNLYYLPNNTMVIDTYGSVDYYDSYHSYRAGKPSKIGNMSIDYYDSYNSYRAGKISSIGGTSIDYYDNYYSYRAGKPCKIGCTSIDYYDTYHSYRAGKPCKIGNSSIDYYDTYHSYRAGKIQSI